jgi:hypothetical protein
MIQVRQGKNNLFIDLAGVWRVGIMYNNGTPEAIWELLSVRCI